MEQETYNFLNDTYESFHKHVLKGHEFSRDIDYLMRLAFYSGAAATLGTITRYAEDDVDREIMEHVMYKHMDEFGEELDQIHAILTAENVVVFPKIDGGGDERTD